MKNLINGILVIDNCEEVKDHEYAGNIEIEKVIISEGVKLIGEEAFAGCENIKEVELPNSLEVIKAGAFFENRKLEQIELNEGLKQILDGAFLSCEKIKKINIPSSLKEIPTMCFYGCGLEKITINENIKEIAEQAFWDNENLKEVNILNKDCVIHSDVFGACYKLSSGYIACGFPIEADDNDEVLYPLLALTSYEKHSEEIKETVKEYAMLNERILMEKIFKQNNAKALNTLINLNIIKGNKDEYLQKAFSLKQNELIALLLIDKQEKEDLSL